MGALMSVYKRGDVVIMPFPYSGAPGEKSRPALILASVPYAGKTDYVVCIISTQNAADPNIIALDMSDVTAGVLRRQSYLRPAYLFTTGENRISRKVGDMKAGPVAAALKTLTTLFQ